MYLLMVRFITTSVHRLRLDLTKDLLAEVFRHIEQVCTVHASSKVIWLQLEVPNFQLYPAGLAILALPYNQKSQGSFST